MCITYVQLCIKHMYMYITYNLWVHTWRHVTLIIKLGRIFKPANLGIRKEQHERTVMMKMILMRVEMVMMMMMRMLLVMIMTMLTMMTMFIQIMMVLMMMTMSVMIMMMTMMMNSWARRKRSWRIVN